MELGMMSDESEEDEETDNEAVAQTRPTGSEGRFGPVRPGAAGP